MKDKAMLIDAPPAAEKPVADDEVGAPGGRGGLTPAARRALAEAEARRAAARAEAPPEEIGGRGGLDPARYGDWEKKGIASDF
jgi:hypothetical protein